MNEFHRLLRALGQSTPKIDSGALASLERESIQVVDVREAHECALGVILGAHLIPRGELESKAEVNLDKSKKTIVYCASGSRSLFACRTLSELGFSDVLTLAGGINAWRDAGLEVHAPEMLSSAERERFARHLVLPDIGEQGQRKLRDAKVLCIGAGGLGSSALYYLAAAGIGTLGIVDNDRVELSNLQRQIIHKSTSVGQLKVDSAAQTLRDYTSLCDVLTYPVRVDADNVGNLIADFDVIVDGSDNIETRRVVSEAARAQNKALVYASVYRFEGQMTFFPGLGGPCFNCLHPSTAETGEHAGSCAQEGVLGVLPGLMGILQATEVIKWITGFGPTMSGRLLTFDAREGEFRTFKLQPSPDCRYCQNTAQSRVTS